MTITVPASVSVLHRLLEPLKECLTPEVAARIAALRADDETTARLDDLAERNREGQLTAEEREEYMTMIDALGLIGVLQAKAHAVVAGR